MIKPTHELILNPTPMSSTQSPLRMDDLQTGRGSITRCHLHPHEVSNANVTFRLAVARIQMGFLESEAIGLCTRLT